MGIGKNGEIIIGVEKGKYIHVNISEGITKEVLEQISKGLSNKEECKIAYNIIEDESKTPKYETVRIWVGKEQVFVSEKAEINPGIYEQDIDER
jgi:uncharacterized protein YpmB